MNTSTDILTLRSENGTKTQITEKISNSVNRFIQWLMHFGETSQDQYDFWAIDIGQRAKSAYYKNKKFGVFQVAPLIFLDSFFPASRKLFRDQYRFPIADAHYAMGFSFLYAMTGKIDFYEYGIHFLEELKKTKCPNYEGHGWGYPFNWMTEAGLIEEFTPLITTTPYVYEAHAAFHEISEDNQLLNILQSTARHVATDYLDDKVNDTAYACSYIPGNKLEGVARRNVVNASAYRSFMLTDAALRFTDDNYMKIAKGNLNYVLSAQGSDGSWHYATNGGNSFIDHFHTCFVLKNLIKIEKLTGSAECRKAIDKGIRFYLEHLIDEQHLPRPFAKIKRLVPFQRELYDYAESINLAVLERENHPELNEILESQLTDLADRWQKPDGSFKTRKLLLGWNKVPYHRWAQSQLFRSLCLYLYTENKKSETLRSLVN